MPSKWSPFVAGPGSRWPSGRRGHVEWVDEWAEDLEIAAEPLARGLVMGVVGLLAAVGLGAVPVPAAATSPGSFVDLCLTVRYGLALGLVADPDTSRLSARPLPAFGGSGGTPKLPLNL
jgi:hypothetical protein